MNKIFKTKWSSAHQQYVVTDEHHATKGKAAKSVAVAVVAALTAGVASAAYMAPSFYEEKAKFETEEYFADWGLHAMKSSSAYALGFTGEDVAVGVMDSGARLDVHPDLKGDRFHASAPEDWAYGTTGNRYPQNVGTKNDPGAFSPTTEVPENLDGNWMVNVNDSHGTHVTGTVGANKDGSEFHGVAFDAHVYVGNTGGTDNTNYGPFQDPKFFYQTWSALAKDVADANKKLSGWDRGGFINLSFPRFLLSERL